MAITATKTGEPFVRDVLVSLLGRSGFYVPFFDIDGGEEGLFGNGRLSKLWYPTFSSQGVFDLC